MRAPAPPLPVGDPPSVVHELAHDAIVLSCPAFATTAGRTSTVVEADAEQPTESVTVTI